MKQFGILLLVNISFVTVTAMAITRSLLENLSS